MKSVKFLELVVLALVGSLLVAFAHAQTIDDYKVEALRVESADVPASVDRPDSARVRMTVLYLNTCYTVFVPAVQRGGSNVIEIYPRATVKRTMCNMLAKPVDKEVNLGMLTQGDYLVRIHNAGGANIDKRMIIR